MRRVDIEDAVAQYNDELEPGEELITVDEYMEVGAFMGIMESKILTAQRYDVQYYSKGAAELFRMGGM